MTTQVMPAPRRHHSVLVFGVAVVVIIALLALLEFTLAQRAAPPLAAGSAPPFEIKTFDGQTLSLAGLRGKPIVLNFWASWCKECRDETPYLELVWQKYREQGLMVIGVDYVDTEPEAKAFLKQFGATYPAGPDLGTAISRAYRITGVPESYFITREGKLLSGTDATGRPYGNWIGPIPPTALMERVSQLMAQ
jgi:cytochrome c biogenesis protein CcmG, thiol:disulfide interchange protein DsbE